MALSDLAVYSEYAYSAMTEVLRQQVDLFNGATNNAIILQSVAHQGDYSDKAFFAAVSGLVRRRNAYGSSTLTEKNLAMIVDTMVKVAAGTPPIRIDQAWWDWIQMDPKVAGAALGQQLAVQTMADMLNTAIGAFYAAHVQVTSQVIDKTGVTAPGDQLSFAYMTQAKALLGDGSGGGIVAWLGHSKVFYDIYQQNLQNNATLFTYDTINVVRDPFGTIMIMTDSPALFTTGTPNKYHTLGLKTGAVRVDQNDDYNANEDTSNGSENIKKTFQAEWSYNLGVKGFQWDKTNGGKSPTDSALFTSTNWDRYATSSKDLGGVIVESH